MLKKKKVAVSDLRQVCDPGVFSFRTTKEVKPLDEVIGQERAVQAIKFGLDMKSRGYNIFVTGVEGTGKSTIVRDLVGRHAKKLSTPCDWCMVNNFKDEYRPRAIQVPSGQAARFARMMHQMVKALKSDLPAAFEGEPYLERLSQIRNRFAGKQQALIRQSNNRMKGQNMRIEQATTGFQAIPLVDGSPISGEQFQMLSDDVREMFTRNIGNAQEEIADLARKINRTNLSLHEQVEKVMDEAALLVVKNRMNSIREVYRDCADIVGYLLEVEADIVENVNIFIPEEKGADKKVSSLFSTDVDPLDKYKINVLVDRKGEKGAPVIVETNPTFRNVFGQIEKRAFMGSVTADFTMVQAGSLLRANGGFLIMEIESVLTSQLLWESLKRALDNKLLSIEGADQDAVYRSASLRPEPIPLDVKVILLGNYEPFQMIQEFDSRFNQIFKVRADFDYEVERNAKNVQKYARFVARACREEGLLPCTPSGLAAIIEFSEKSLADKNRLSLRFGTIIGVLREADYWARKGGSNLISERYVVKSFNEYRFRYNLYEEKMHTSYVDNTIKIDVAGDVVGQVNALAVYQVGEISFGRPSRITAEAFMGKEGIINIEREADMSGSTHNKGVLILSGYLGRMFAQHHPLNISISITFEQSYSGVDGDSASSTELYAILSSLADVPIHQGIAVTGSVNQKGEIQSVGGINQKVEGFFDVCRSKGLTGRQGVMIPASNVNNLMLKREVVDAVNQGQFNVYQVATIQEGIEILTGIKAGAPGKKGAYPKKTVYGMVQQKLKEYFQRSMRSQKDWEKEDGS